MGIGAINPIALDDVLTRADLRRGNALAQGSTAGHATGYAELDARLPGGGWPRGALVEILLAAARGLNVAGVGEVSLLLPALGRHTRDGGFAALIAPAHAVHAPAWAAAGVELSRLILVRPAREAHQDALWAAEQVLRSGAVGFVLAWLPQAEVGSLKRLQRAAETGGACAVVFRPAQCAGQSSPAALRLLVSGAGEGASVAIVKRRGPPLARPIPVAVARPRCVARRARAAEFAVPQQVAPLCA